MFHVPGEFELFMVGVLTIVGTVIAAIYAVVVAVKVRRRQFTSLVTEEAFDFLGYTFGRYYSTRNGRAYYGIRPFKNSVKRIFRTVSELTARNRTFRDVQATVGLALLIEWSSNS